MRHALAVAVEPFKFSSRQGGVAYELSGDEIGRIRYLKESLLAFIAIDHLGAGI